MGLFRPDTEEFTEENALLTAITGKDGSFSFENIPYGHWIVKEISAPDLYTVSPQQHHVYIGADGQHIEIRVENTLIRGSVQVTKTEAVEEPSPVEKEDKKDKNSFLRFLSGAVFDLYADSNANQEYDPDDQKIGTCLLYTSTSYYGYRVHPISGKKNYHTGVDIGMPEGTEILAGHDGTVRCV